MNQMLHIFYPRITDPEKRPRTSNLSTIHLLEKALSHIPPRRLAQSQDCGRPVSKRPRCNRRDKPASTARLTVNLPSQQDSKFEPRSQIRKISQLPVKLTIVRKNRPRLLKISTIETRYRVNHQQSRNLRQQHFKALCNPDLFTK